MLVGGVVLLTAKAFSLVDLVVVLLGVALILLLDDVAATSNGGFLSCFLAFPILFCTILRNVALLSGS